jgi:hypothetical protein
VGLPYVVITHISEIANTKNRGRFLMEIGKVKLPLVLDFHEYRSHRVGCPSEKRDPLLGAMLR